MVYFQRVILSNTLEKKIGKIDNCFTLHNDEISEQPISDYLFTPTQTYHNEYYYDNESEKQEILKDYIICYGYKIENDLPKQKLFVISKQGEILFEYDRLGYTLYIYDNVLLCCEYGDNKLYNLVTKELILENKTTIRILQDHIVFGDFQYCYIINRKSCEMQKIS